MTNTIKPIPGHHGYFADTEGNIWSRNGRILPKNEMRKLKTQPHYYGYPMVDLYTNRKSTRYTVHSLVLWAFWGPPPENKEGCHNDGNPKNNKLSNLRYDTHHANVLDMVKHRRNFLKAGARHPYAKLNKLQVSIIRHLEGKMTCVKIAEFFPVTAGHIGRLWRGKNWKTTLRI